MMAAVSSPERSRMHPHKFTLWVGVGSIIMMFAGLTSAYIVRRNQTNWLEFSLPPVFWLSTVVILSSSFTMYLSVQAFKARLMQRYKVLIGITASLGLLFAVLQGYGFYFLESHRIWLTGPGSNPSASFIAVIVGLHVLHVLGGVIALVVTFIAAYRTRIKNYNATRLEIVGTYWHFVDVLWIYLFIFFSLI